MKSSLSPEVPIIWSTIISTLLLCYILGSCKQVPDLIAWTFSFLALSSFVFELLPRLGALRASKNLHAMLLAAILGAPLHFTDTTPLGRILSRISSDVETADNKIMYILSDMYYFTCQVLRVVV